MRPLLDELSETWTDMQNECAHPWALRFALIGSGTLAGVLLCIALFN